MEKRLLTGVKPTGTPHIGNYLGAMRPALDRAATSEATTFLFIADYHALTSVTDPKLFRQQVYEVTATWLACGLDPERTVIYCQSDVPEVFELNWILACSTAKGLMNRAHSYKAKLADNAGAERKDPDYGVSMGLFTYPILMAADILLFSATDVPVGKDQIQHVEMTRDMAQKFNRTYGEILKVPNFIVDKNAQTVLGLDGRKMSKSYDNYIPIFEPSKGLRKKIMKIKTDSSAPEDPKDPDESVIFKLYQSFASLPQQEELRVRYAKGIGWGEAKQELFLVIDDHFTIMREKFNALMEDTAQLDLILDQGAQKARKLAAPLMAQVRSAVGARPR